MWCLITPWKLCQTEFEYFIRFSGRADSARCGLSWHLYNSEDSDWICRAISDSFDSSHRNQWWSPVDHSSSSKCVTVYSVFTGLAVFSWASDSSDSASAVKFWTTGGLWQCLHPCQFFLYHSTGADHQLYFTAGLAVLVGKCGLPTFDESGQSTGTDHPDHQHQ